MCKIPVCCCMWVNVSELCFASRSQGWDESCFAKIYYKNKFSIQQIISVEIRFLPPSQTIILQKLKNEHFVLTLVGDGGIRIIEVGLHHTHLHHTRWKVTLLA